MLWRGGRESEEVEVKSFLYVVRAPYEARPSNNNNNGVCSSESDCGSKASKWPTRAGAMETAGKERASKYCVKAHTCG